jgi:hypothetical protein
LNEALEMNKLSILVIVTLIAVLFVYGFTRPTLPQSQTGAGAPSPTVYPTFAGITLDENGDLATGQATTAPTGWLASPTPKVNEIIDTDFDALIASAQPVECELVMQVDGKDQAAKMFMANGLYALQFKQLIGNESYDSIYVFRSDGIYYKYIGLNMWMGNQSCDWMVLKTKVEDVVPLNESDATQILKDLPKNEVSCKPGTFSRDKFVVPANACDVKAYMQATRAAASPMPTIEGVPFVYIKQDVWDTYCAQAKFDPTIQCTATIGPPGTRTG